MQPFSADSQSIIEAAGVDDGEQQSQMMVQPVLVAMPKDNVARKVISVYQDDVMLPSKQLWRKNSFATEMVLPNDCDQQEEQKVDSDEEIFFNFNQPDI